MGHAVRGQPPAAGEFPGREQRSIMLEALAELVAQFVHIVLVLVAAPGLAGTTDWFEARLAGRAGPSLLEPFQDLVRLSRKAPALPENASPVLTLAPAVSL